MSWTCSRWEKGTYCILRLICASPHLSATFLIPLQSQRCQHNKEYVKQIWFQPPQIQYIYLIKSYFGITGQTSWHAGSLCPSKWQFGWDSAHPPQEVCGPGHSAHASSWLGCTGDEALCEGAGLPWGADWLTYQQLGPKCHWTLPFLCCETLNIAGHAYLIAQSSRSWKCTCVCTKCIPRCETVLCFVRSSSPSWRYTDLTLCLPRRQPRSWAAPYLSTHGTCRQMGGWLSIGCHGWWVREMRWSRNWRYLITPPPGHVNKTKQKNCFFSWKWSNFVAEIDPCLIIRA